MYNRKIAFIGAGNMTRSIISGLVASGYDARSIIASNPSVPKLAALEADFHINTTQCNVQACKFADVIILAVKPQLMEQLCNKLQGQTSFENKLFVSIAAGLPISRIQEMLGEQYPIVRVMPNTPSLIGKGMAGLFADNSISSEDRQFVAHIMAATGEVLWVNEEKNIDGVIAAAGSSPAYFFLFLQFMQQKTTKLGFSDEDARLLVQQAMLGAAEMVVKNPQLSLSELREQVTSKGGTTAAAINSFVHHDLEKIIDTAMQDAVNRAEEMASQL